MAKWVVLAFDDDKEADNFVNQILKANESQFEGEQVLATLPVPTFVEAVYKKPTRYCNCVNDPSVKLSGRRVRGWTKGLKFGWYVCPKCRRPANYQGRIWETLFRNLLTNPLEQKDETNQKGLADHSQSSQAGSSSTGDLGSSLGGN